MTSGAIFEPGDLLKALTNVNYFVPARSLCPVVRIHLVPMFRATAADFYTVGIDEAEPEDHYGMPAEVIISAADSKVLEKFIRGAKKDGIELVIDLEEELCLKFITARNVVTQEVEVAFETFADGDAGKWERFFRAIDEDIMAPFARRTPAELVLPDAIAFQPSRLAAFAKVKGSDETSVMDLRIYDAETPVHVRIGETFRGAIQPITREMAGQGALWES